MVRDLERRGERISRTPMVLLALCVVLISTPAEAGRRRCRGDIDCDGIPNRQERELGTNRRNADSDRDGLSDGFEVNVVGSDPKLSDSDGDGIPDGEEARSRTDPRQRDTDKDGLPDGDDCDPLNILTAKIQGSLDAITCPTQDAGGSITILGLIIALTPRTSYGAAQRCAGLKHGAHVAVRVSIDADMELFADVIDVKDAENDGCPDAGGTDPG